MSAEERVLQYMQECNRPFNVQNIADMLAQFGVKKPQIERALTALADRGQVLCKEFGKSKIYTVPQDNLVQLSKEELDQVKKEVGELSKSVKAKEEAVKAMQKGLSAVQTNLTIAEIQTKTEAIKQQVLEAQTKLDTLKNGALLVSKTDRNTAEKAFAANMAQWSKRKRVFRDLWDAMSENLEQNQQELFEEIGIENDDVVGCDYAALAQLLPKKARR